jgi:uncharacterized protein (DUF736 family)
VLKRVGVLWKPKEGQQTKSVLSGSIELLGEDIRVVILKNEKKEKANQPDYQIMRVLPGDEEKPDTPKGEQTPF